MPPNTHKPAIVQPPHTSITLAVTAFKAMSDKTSAVLKMPTLTQPHHGSITQVTMKTTAHLKRWTVRPQLGEALAPSRPRPRERQRNLDNTRLWPQRLPHVHCGVVTPNWWPLSAHHRLFSILWCSKTHLTSRSEWTTHVHACHSHSLISCKVECLRHLLVPFQLLFRCRLFSSSCFLGHVILLLHVLSLAF